MTLPRVVLSSNRIDLRSDKTAALKSMLIELGYNNPYDFVDTLFGASINNSFSSYILLPYYLNNPGLATCSCTFLYVLQQISRNRLIDLVTQAAGRRVHGLKKVLPLLQTVDFTNYTAILDYFGFLSTDPISFLEDLDRYPEWIESSLPEMQPFCNALRNNRIDEIIKEVIFRQTRLNLINRPQKYAEVKHWSRVTFSSTVLGSDYNQ
jgi:hypothetical protein